MTSAMTLQHHSQAEYFPHLATSAKYTQLRDFQINNYPIAFEAGVAGEAGGERI
ncbi:hypothetical protein [Nostoc sp. T09]|uniref:hypothetical protein n=1 Tax=Nostoc sp. T09 TaxID=1932621 RepID=UPI0015C4F0B1|nr:hypothetical protein [Nostoc sp. T09]